MLSTPREKMITPRAIPDTPREEREEREELAQLLRSCPGIEEALGCWEGCSDNLLVESLLRHDSPFELLHSLGLVSGAGSETEGRLTPRVRALACIIEAKLSPRRQLPSPARTPGGLLARLLEARLGQGQRPSPAVPPLGARRPGHPAAAAAPGAGAGGGIWHAASGLGSGLQRPAMPAGVATAPAAAAARRGSPVRTAGAAAPQPLGGTGRWRGGTASVQDSAFDWRREALAATAVPSPSRASPFPPSFPSPPRGPPPSPPASRTSRFQAPPLRAPRFHLGQSVRVAFTEDGLQMTGIVTCAEPLLVRPQGMSESFEFAHAEAEADATPRLMSDADVDAVKQAVAGKNADKCAVSHPSIDTVLASLGMARLCLQEGNPQLAKVYMEQIGVIDGKAGTIPTPTMEMEGTADRGEDAAPVPVQEPAEVDSHRPEFEPTALDAAAGIVSDEGEPMALDADSVRYLCGRALGERGAEGVGGRCGPEGGPHWGSCRRPQVLLEAPSGPRFVVSQRVMFADHEASERTEGTVTCADPLLIRPDGYEESFDFNLVEPLDLAQPGGSETACVGVQDASVRSLGGGRAERLAARERRRKRGLRGMCVDTCTSRVRGLHETCTERVRELSAAPPVRGTSAPGRPARSPRQDHAATTEPPWLSGIDTCTQRVRGLHETCTQRVRGLSAASPMRGTSAPGRPARSPRQGDAATTETPWLSGDSSKGAPRTCTCIDTCTQRVRGLHETCTQRVRGLSAAPPVRGTSAPGRPARSPQQGEAATTEPSWLSCCFAH